MRCCCVSSSFAAVCCVVLCYVVLLCDAWLCSFGEFDEYGAGSLLWLLDRTAKLPVVLAVHVLVGPSALRVGRVDHVAVSSGYDPDSYDGWQHHDGRGLHPTRPFPLVELRFDRLRCPRAVLVHRCLCVSCVRPYDGGGLLVESFSNGGGRVCVCVLLYSVGNYLCLAYLRHDKR